ncbi:hypothetical protein IID10_04140 [candidate division KSB1 bacterium]|nr:hypothetical protein [candidate division KSB1 bacterium]
MRLTTCGVIFVILTFVPMSAKALPGSADTSLVPYLKSGAIEAGFSGSLNIVEGISNASAAVRGGTFFGLLNGLVGAELEVAYSHVNSLDVIDLQAFLTWQRKLGKSAVYPFVTVGGGLRQEFIGSFQLSRYPLGFGAGLHLLITQSSAIRVEYKLKRILNDPISNFTEHHVRIGISILFRNSRNSK